MKGTRLDQPNDAKAEETGAEIECVRRMWASGGVERLYTR
jgi:hypothetical protein